MLADLSRLSNAESRSISPENPTGARGAGGQSTDGLAADSARELGQGWKVSPYIRIGGNETVTLAEIDGPGAIEHIWLTVHPTHWRRLVLRMYWDGEETPSVETPLGDFFCSGWCVRCNIGSIPVAVNPAGGFNSYWRMPFRTVGPHHRREPLARGGWFLLFLDRLHANGHSRGCRLFPCPMAAGKPASLRRGAHHPRWRAGARSLCRHLYCLGGEQQRLVGRRRGEVLSRWRPRLADHLRHRHRGLFRRRLEFRAPASGNTVRFPPPSWDCRRSSNRTVSIRASNASACTAGIFPTRSVFARSCASPSRRSVGAPPWKASAAISRCRTTSPPPRSGTNRNRTRRSRQCRR